MEPYLYNEEYETGGTGFFVNPSIFGKFPKKRNCRYLLTNFHVVRHLPLRTCLLEWPRRASSYLSAKVIYVVPQLDVAILEVDTHAKHSKWWGNDVQSFLKDVPNLVLDTTSMIKGNSQKCKAIGFPNLQEDYQLSDGVISGRGLGMIQMDITLNGGNSGGPLFYRNKVIGICTASVADSERLGLAVPMQMVYSFFTKWATYTTCCLRTPTWGIIQKVLTPDYMDYKNIASQYKGTLVKKVLPAQAADQAGLKKDDIIMRIISGDTYQVDMHGKVTVPWTDKQVPITDSEFILSLSEDVVFEVYRNRRVKRIYIQPRVIDFKVRVRYPYYEEVDYECYGGMVFTNLCLNQLQDSDDEEEDYSNILHDVQSTDGLEDMVIVSHIAPQSHVDTVGLKEFDRIKSVNKRKVENVKELGKLLDANTSKEFIEIETKDDTHVFKVSNLAVHENTKGQPHDKLRLKKRRLY